MKLNKLLYKVIAWRLVSIISMLLVVWLLTGKFIESVGFTIIVQIVQTIVHTIFELVWEKQINHK